MRSLTLFTAAVAISVLITTVAAFGEDPVGRTAASTHPATQKADSDRPEVFFLGPIQDTALLYDLIYSYLIESGVYVDVGTDGRLPEQLPWDLSRYKVVIVDKDLPIMKYPGTKEHLERYEGQGGHVIYYQREKEPNWKSNDPELYEMFDAVTKKYGVRTQNPAFLKRNAARPDKEVILACAEAMTKVPNLTNWYLIGNDVAYMHFEGLLKTADLYGRPDIRGFVVWMMGRIAEKHGEAPLPIYGGHLIAEFRGPGFEPYLKRTLAEMPTADSLKVRAAEWKASGRFLSGESMEPLGNYAARGRLFNEPEYFQPTVDMMKQGYKALFDPQTKLWAHGGQWDGPRTPPWSRGYGWMLLGLCGIVENLPKDHPDYPLMVRYLEETAEGLIRTQDGETGLWHNIVDDPTTRLESSGTCMIVRAYCQAWRAGACRTPQVKEMLTKAWYGLKAHTVGPRTFSFLWGKGPSHDKESYSLTPSSGTPYIPPLAGPEYVKTFGPLVP